MEIKANQITAEFIKQQAAQGKKVVQVTHKDGSVTYETRPIEPVTKPKHALKTGNPLVDYRPKQSPLTYQQQPVKRTKSKKKFSAKKLLPFVLVPVLIAGGAGPVYKYGIEPVNQYNEQNQIFDIDKVKEDLQFYGGDSRYVAANRSLFGFKNPELYTHFNLEEDRPIKVGMADNISDEYKEQFKHTFDYVNSIFQTINPDIRFEIIEGTQSDCDVWIQSKALNQNIGMNIVNDRDKLTGSQLTGAVINVNSSLEMSGPRQRFFLLHELLHLLTGSNDVDYTKSPTFSVYNYNDIAFIIDQVENAWESEEEKKAAMDGKFTTVRPILSAEEKDSWVTYLPTDIGTLIALYGDSSIASNREAYIDLLNQTLADCSEKFGENQPFFVDDFVVPTNQNSTTPKNNDDDLSY